MQHRLTLFGIELGEKIHWGEVNYTVGAARTPRDSACKRQESVLLELWT
jgi:hypothetical protein